MGSEMCIRDRVEQVRRNIERYSNAEIVLAESSVIVNNPEEIKGKKVLVVEDGPTLTHGGMPYGAAKIAAETFKAAQIVDPREPAAGSIKEVYRNYPHIDAVLPAMGYNKEQVHDLETTINNARCDLVLFATPIHLTRILNINKPARRVLYEYHDHGRPTLQEVLVKRFAKLW